MVSQDGVIASLTQELSELKERHRVLETRVRVPDAPLGQVPNVGGEGVLTDTELAGLSTEPASARQEAERLSRELSSLRDEKLILVVDLNSVVLAKEALAAEKDHLIFERDAAFIERGIALAEKDSALAEKDSALAEKDSALAEKVAALSERDTALAEKEQALKDLGRISAERDEISLALGKAVSEKGLAEVDKDQAVADRESVLERLEGIEGRYQKIRKKYRHCKAKVRRLSEQLSFVPWLRTKAWAFGFHVGFENFRALVLRSDQPQVSVKNVSSNFLPLSSSCYSALLDLGIEYFPDVSDWSKDAPNPEDVSSGDINPKDDRPGGE